MVEYYSLGFGASSNKMSGMRFFSRVFLYTSASNVPYLSKYLQSKVNILQMHAIS